MAKVLGLKMHLGFSTQNNPGPLRPDALAKELEDRGFDSLFIGEHSHIPASRKTPHPSGGPLPDSYLQMMDPFISLAMAAQTTTKLKLGTGIALCLEHDVFDLAKTVATLDYLSEGRVLFGVGVGWNEEELANVSNVPWNRRYSALEECVGALRSLWSDHDSEFHGEFYNFDPVWSYPKPAQVGGPPVLMGMGGKLGTKHTVRYGDQWMPMDVAFRDIEKTFAKFREAASEAGRGEIPISLIAFGEPTIERLHFYKGLGVERVILGSSRPGEDDPSTTLPFLDKYAKFVDELA